MIGTSNQPSPKKRNNSFCDSKELHKLSMDNDQAFQLEPNSNQDRGRLYIYEVGIKVFSAHSNA